MHYKRGATKMLFTLIVGALVVAIAAIVTVAATITSSAVIASSAVITSTVVERIHIANPVADITKHVSFSLTMGVCVRHRARP